MHTRLPIVIPERVTDDLLDWLTGTRLTPIVVVHANHPAEIDDAVAAALGRLVDSGMPLLNQAVLLRGVNDYADTLAELCERLIDLRVIPYYLHQLDRVAGAAHFEVPVEQGREIMAALKSRLPGYAVPRYVQEIAGRSQSRICCKDHRLSMVQSFFVTGASGFIGTRLVWELIQHGHVVHALTRRGKLEPPPGFLAEELPDFQHTNLRLFRRRHHRSGQFAPRHERMLARLSSGRLREELGAELRAVFAKQCLGLV